MSISQEYRVDIKVRNNLFIEHIEKAGYKTIGEFCRVNKLAVSRISEIVSMKRSPLKSNGDFQLQVKKSAEILHCFPEDLFSESQMNMAIKNNKYCIKVNEAEVKYMLDCTKQPLLLEEDVIEDQKNKLLKKALDTLPEREKKILTMRFGLEDGIEHHFDEIAKEFGCSRERVRQLEQKALRRLRNPVRTGELDELFNKE